MPYANNKDAGQPAHPRNLISTFVVHCLDSIISLVSILAISCLQLASVAEQVTWSQNPKTGFLMTKLKCKFQENEFPAKKQSYCRLIDIL